nr:GTP-binding protein [Cedratvirus borely]
MSQIKVMLVGNSGAYKSSLLYSLLGFARSEIDLPPTLGVEAHNYGKYVLWDMAGKPKYCMGKGLFYHNAQIGIVVHGGEEYLTPEQWELDLKASMGDACQVYHVEGTFEEKLARMRTILC